MALKMDRDNNLEALFDKFAIDPQKENIKVEKPQNSKLEEPAEVEEEKNETGADKKEKK